MTLDFTFNASKASEQVSTPDRYSQPEWPVSSQQFSSTGSLVAKQQNCSNLSLGISKHNSLDLDESLGILTPDQMTDFTMTDESFHRTISCEGIANMPEFKTDVSSSSLKATDHLLSDVTNMESTPVEDITMNSIMEFDDCLSSKSEYLHMNRELAGSLETSSSYFEHDKNNPSGLNCLVERTPSCEDLPMDGIIMTQENHHSEGPSNNATSSAQLIPNPNSFITSVTSIASLDNGYQGDGELSRPTSRGADHSPTAHQNVKLKVIADSMTDSDFFTESDADVHEDLGRGDRRAQVIDGIIYGGQPNQSPSAQCRKSLTHSQIMEEMESSGVYSDVERKPEDQLDTTLKPSVENMDQKMESTDEHVAISSELIHDTSPSEASTNMDETGASTETLQNATGSSPDLKQKEAKKAKSDTLNKKFKMPNRNVTSKVKSMISSQPIRKTPDDEAQETRKPRPNKKGKWDAVMDKIAQGQTEKKTQPRIKEVKSKVFSKITVNPPDTKRPNQKEFQLSHSTSTRSLRETNETKAKKRTRVRSSELSTQSAGNCRSNPSQNSSRNSSVTDLSEQTSKTISTASSSSSTYTRSIKKQNGGVKSGGLSSPVSDETTGGKLTLPRLKEAITSRSTSSINVIQNKSSTKDGKSITKASASRKQVIRPLRDHNRLGPATTQRVKTETNNNNVSNGHITNNTVHNNNVQTRIRTTTSTVETRTTVPPSAGVVGSNPAVAELVPQLQHAVTAVDALGVLVQYLTVNLEAFSNPALKKEVDRMRREWHQSKEDLARAEASYKELQESLASQHHKYEEEVVLLKNTHEKDLVQLRNTHEDIVQTMLASHEEELVKLTRAQEEQSSSLHKKLKQETEQLSAERKEEILRLERNHIEAYEALKIELKKQIADQEKEAEARLSKLMEEYTKNSAEMRTRIAQLESEKETLSMQYSALTDVNTKNPSSKLTHEVESLHHVLDLRNKDISELRMQNAFLAQDVEDLPNVRTKVTAQQTRIEDLTIQLERKSEVEQDLLTENRSLKEYYRTEAAKVQTLQRQNEELQYALKQKSEALNVLAHSTPKKMSANCNHGKKTGDMSERKKSVDESTSSPTSPKVMGVVEKSDSVSWVVELEDAPDIVSKYLRRTNSFRSVSASSPVKRPVKTPRPSPAPTDRERVRSVSVPVDSSADKENLWEMEMSRSADNSLAEGEFDTFDLSNIDSKDASDGIFFDRKSTFSLDLQPSDILPYNEEDEEKKMDEDVLLGMSMVKDAAGEAMISSGEDSSSRTTSSCSHSDSESTGSSEDMPLLGNQSSVEPKSLDIHRLGPILPERKAKCKYDDKIISNFSKDFHAAKPMEHEP